jgi:uncharacterized protein YerC
MTKAERIRRLNLMAPAQVLAVARLIRAGNNNFVIAAETGISLRQVNAVFAAREAGAIAESIRGK